MKNLKLVFLTLFLVFSLSSIFSVDYTWIGGDGNWSDTAKWSSVPNTPGTYPDGVDDSATIPSPAATDITIITPLTVGNVTLEAGNKIRLYVNEDTTMANLTFQGVAKSEVNVPAAKSLTVSGSVLGDAPSSDGLDLYGKVKANGIGGTLNLNIVNGISSVEADNTAIADITSVDLIAFKLRSDHTSTISADSITDLELLEVRHDSLAYVTGTIGNVKVAESSEVYAYRKDDNTIGYDLTVNEFTQWDLDCFLQGPLDDPVNTEASLTLNSTIAVTLDVREMFNNVTLDTNVNITTASDLTIYGTLDASGSTVTSSSTVKGFTVYDITALDTLIVDDLVLGKRTAASTYLQDGTYNIGTFTKNGTGGVHIGASTLNITGSSNTFDISSNGGTLILNSGTLNLVDQHLNQVDITLPWADQFTTSSFYDIYLLTNTAIVNTAGKSLTVDKPLAEVGSIYGDGQITSTAGLIDVTGNVSLDTLNIVNPGQLSIALDTNVTNLTLNGVSFSPGENLFTTNTTLTGSAINIGNGKEFVVSGNFSDALTTSSINADNSRISINTTLSDLSLLNLGSNTTFNLTGSSQIVIASNVTVGTDTVFNINDNTLELETLTGTPIISSSGGAVDMGTTGSAYIKGSFNNAVAVGTFTYVGDVELIGPGGDIEAATVESNNFKTTITGTSTIIGTSINLTDVVISPTGTFTLDNNITVSGDWDNQGGTFTHNSRTVTFDDASKTSHISGSSIFWGFTCLTDSKSFIFEAGEKQTITHLNLQASSSSNSINLSSSIPGSPWNIEYNPGSLQTWRLMVSDSNASTGTTIDAALLGIASYDGGGNTNWTGFSSQNTWQGDGPGSVTDWNNSNNWSTGVVPQTDVEAQNNRAVIPAGLANYPILTGAYGAYRVMIAQGAQIDVADQNLVVNTTLRNQGVIRLKNGGKVTDTDFISPKVDTGSGIVEFYDTAINTSGWGGDFYSLKINTTGTVTLSATSRVSGQLDIVSGALDLGTSSITVVGNINTYDKTSFIHSGQLLTIDGNSQLTGEVELSALTINSGSLTLNSPISVAGDLINSADFYTNNKLVTFNGTTLLSGNYVAFNDLEVSSVLTLGTAIGIGGDLINSGTFTPGAFEVEFISGLGPSKIYGNNVFSTFTCYASGKTLEFESNKTQTITTLNLKGSEAGLITLKPIDVLDGKFTLSTSFSSVDYIDVTSSNLIGSDIDAQYHSIDSGGNEVTTSPKWIFRKDIYLWNGSQDNLWTNKNNWEKTSDPGVPVLFLPGSTDWVKIPITTNSPIITTAVDLKSINILDGGIVELGTGSNLNSTYINNNGTIKVTDSGAVINNVDLDSGTTEFAVAVGDVTTFSPTYYNLKISNSSGASALSILGNLNIESNFTLSGTLNVTGDINLTSGIFLANNNNITVGANWNRLLGTFTPGTNTVYFNNISILTGDTVFNNVEISSSGTLSIVNNITVNNFINYGIVNAGSTTIKVSGNWTNTTGTFNRDSSTVEFIAGTTTILGDTVFNIFKCITPLKTINFSSGSTQTFYDLNIAGTSGNLITLQGAANWTFKNLRGSEAVVSFVDIKYGQVFDSGPTGSIRAFSSISDINTDTATGTSNWIMDATAPRTLTWVGDHLTTPSLWSEPTNWHVLGVDALTPPSSIDSVIIPTGILSPAEYPTLTAAADLFDLTIQNGAILDLSTQVLTVNGTLENLGTIKRSGAGNQLNKTDTDSGTVIYQGVGASNIQLYTGVDYFNLVISDGIKTVTSDIVLTGNLDTTGATSVDFTSNLASLTFSGTALSDLTLTPGVTLYDLIIDKSASSVAIKSSITVDNDLTVNQGTLNLAGGVGNSITVNRNINIVSGVVQSNDETVVLKGNWNNSGGTYTGGATSQVQFIDSLVTSNIIGNNTFETFFCNVQNKTIRFSNNTGEVQTINNFNITGGTGVNRINLLSTLSGNQWKMSATTSTSVSNVFVEDSYLTAGLDIVAAGDSDITTRNKVAPSPSPIWKLQILFTWDGNGSGINTNWFEPTNWDVNSVPNDLTHDVLIPNVTNFPSLTAPVSVNNVTIDPGASLTTNGNNVTFNTGGVLVNKGRLIRTGAETINKHDSTVLNNGTVAYIGAGAGTIQDYGANYINLEVSDGTKTAAGHITVEKNLTLTNAAAVLNTGTNNISINTGVAGTGIIDSSNGNFTLTNGVINFKGTYNTVSIATGSSASTLNNNLTIGAGGIGGAGTLVAGTSNTITLNGPWAINNFTHDTSTVKIGTTQTLVSTTDHEFYSLVVEGAGTTLTQDVTGLKNVIIRNDLTITGTGIALGNNSKLELYGYRTATTGAITGTGTSSVHWMGTNLTPPATNLNFDTLTLDLIFKNDVVVRANSSIKTAGNITFERTLNGHSTDPDNITIETTGASKQLRFDGIIGGAIADTAVGSATFSSPATGSMVVNSNSIRTNGNLLFNTAVTANQALTINTTGTITIGSGTINAAITSSPLTNNLILQATGNILDGTSAAEDPLLIANSISLLSTTGSIGLTGGGDIDVNCTTLVQASSGLGGVFVTQDDLADRDLNITYVNSIDGPVTIINEATTAGSGDVFIDSGVSKGIFADIIDDIVSISTSQGAIMPLGINTDLEIVGSTINLLATAGTCGSVTNEIHINAVNEFNSTSALEAWIYDTAGNLPVKTVTVTGVGSEARISSIGNISQVNLGKITSEKLLLTSNSIGALLTPLLTNVSNLEVSAISNVYIEEDNALTVGGISGIIGITSTTGEVRLNLLADSASALTVSEKITAGWNLYLSTKKSTVTLNANLELSEILDIYTNTGGDDALTGADIVINNPILNHGDGLMTFNGGTGNITINSNITSDCATPGVDTKKVSFLSDVLLGGVGPYVLGTTLPLTIDLDVEFAKTVNNTGSLVINAGIGYVDFNGVIGGTTALSSLTIGNASRTDFVGIGIGSNGLTGALNVTTDATADGIIFLEGDNYRVGGDITFRAGNKTTVAEKTGLLIQPGVNNMTLSFNRINLPTTIATYIYGADPGGARNIVINSTDLTPVTFLGDMHISIPNRTIQSNISFIANNLVLYNGILDLDALFNISTTQDLVLLGSLYDIQDPDTLENIFNYNSAFRTDPLWTLVDPNTTVLSGSILTYTLPVPPVTTGPSPYSGGFNDLAGTTFTVGGNFFNNGSNMTGSGPWNLNVPLNSDAAISFSEAYNMTVTNCDPSNPIAAAEGVTAPALTNWKTARPELDGTVTIPSPEIVRTVYDDVIEIRLLSGSFENSQNEISKALVSGLIGVNNNAITGADLQSYTTPLCTVSTDGQGDLAVFYLRVENNPAYRWNTDATGSSSGSAVVLTTDRGRSGVPAVQRSTIPNLDISKNAAGVYFTLKDSFQNRIDHTSATHPNPTLNFTATADGTSPAITGVIASNHGTTGDSVDNKNYFEITFSEPVTFTTGATFPLPQNTRSSSVVLTGSSKELGYITQSGPDVEVHGLFKYPGNFISGSFDGNANANALFSPSTSPTLPYKLRIDVVGYFNTKWPGYLGSTATNIDNYTKISNPSTTFIRGDFNGSKANLITALAGEVALQGQITTVSRGINVLANSDINDSAGNSIEQSDTVTPSNQYDSYFKTMAIGGTGWDVFPPFFAKLPAVSGISEDIYEIYFVDQDGSDDRITDKILFNTLDDHIMQPFWDSLTGWTEGAPTIGTRPNTLGGLRDYNLTTPFISGFSYGLSSETPITSTTTGATTVVDLSLLSASGPITTGNDGYFSIDFNSTALPYRWILRDIMSLEYNSAVGQLTDLAGNLLPSSNGKIKAYQWIPPEILISLGQVNSRSMYIQFTKAVYGNRPSAAARTGLAPTAFNLTGTEDGNSVIDVLPVVGSSTIGQAEFLLTLAKPLSGNDMVSARIQFNADSVHDYFGTAMLPTDNKRMSDLGIGLAYPVYADDTLHRDNNLTKDGALRVFDGTGRILPEDIVIATKVEGSNNQELDLSMYYGFSTDLSGAEDYDINDNLYNPNLWLPEGVAIPGVFQFKDLGLKEVINPDKLNGLNLFPIPNNDPNLVVGNVLEFIYKLGTIPEPLYCVNIPDGGSTLSDLNVWEIPLSELKKQRGGVTIVNNVINPLDGNRTEIFVEQEKPGMCTVVIFSIDGNIVKKLQSGRQGAGRYRYQWNGTNKSGTPVARGVYFVKVVAPGIDESRKVMIVK